MCFQGFSYCYGLTILVHPLKGVILLQYFIQDMRIYLSPLSNWDGTSPEKDTRFLRD